MTLHPTSQLHEMLNGFWVAQCLFVAARLDIADRVHAGPQSVEALAAATDVDPERLHRLLRALAAVGVFEEVAPRCFGQSSVSEWLRSDIEGTQRPRALFYGEVVYPAWAGLARGMRAPHVAFDAVHGPPLWAYFDDHEQHRHWFDAMLASRIALNADAICSKFDFGRAKRIVDVGGGSGTMLAALLIRNPRLEGVTLDRPDVAARAEVALARAGLGSRAEARGGDFFAGVPAGGDVYVLFSVLHNWSDERALRILRVCRDAVAPGAAVLIVDVIVTDEGAERARSYFQDLHMLVMCGGCERTEQQLRDLLAEAGFRFEATHALRPPLSMIVARAE